MKFRATLVTAVALLALTAPTAQAHIPSDYDGMWFGKSKPRVTLTVKDTKNPFAARTIKHTTGWTR